MKTNRLGCLTIPGLVALVIVLSSVAGVTAFAGGLLFSPGALNAQSKGSVLGGVRTHADILPCGSCHTAPWDARGMSENCLACHTDLVNGNKDFHLVMLSEGQRTACFACHTEHHGAQGSLTIIDLKDFPHEKLGFSLHAHLKGPDGAPFTCSNCHPGQYKEFSLTTCATCHQKMNAGWMSQHLEVFGAGCTDCHDGQETYGKKFDHNKVNYPLNGKHAGLDCLACHAGARKLTDLKATSQDCATCHAKDEPHEGRFGKDCAACHTPEGWKPAKFDHKLAAFQLTGKHEKVECQQCHVNDKYRGTPQDCYSCHAKDDRHEGQLGQDCARCHTPDDWKPSTFIHSTASFTLIGKHAEVKCESCHVDLKFKDTPQDCYSCHKKDDPHSGQLGQDCARCHTPDGWKPSTFDHSTVKFTLIGKHAQVSCTGCHSDLVFKNTPQDCFSCHSKDDKHAGQYGKDCALCHSPAGWKPSTFNHAKTAFPLTGAHLGPTCTSCHADGKFKGTPKDCIACHKQNDQHQGQLGSDCGACHTTSTWKGAKFDHSKAAFQLTGSHIGVACKACHTTGQYKGTPKDCYSCHKLDDHHNGQFGTDCSTCHTPSAWKNVTFDHSRAAFKLTGAHSGVACTSCHANGQFKGTPSDCYSCHRQNDHHNGQFGTDCGACHSTSSWQGATFDHSRTGFPLTGAHVGQACSACHASGQYKGTPSDCYSCHRQDDHHNGQFGTDCGTCHSTSSWQGATFDHSRTSFPLSGAHAGLACTSCHSGGQFAGTPTACSACHAEPAFHAGVLGTDCGACHTTNGWTPASYNGPHTFPMSHGNPDSCQTCHPSSLGSYTCYSCHDQTEMEKHHLEKGITDISNCVACHPTGNKQ